MPAKLTEKERIKLIERVILKGEPVSRACQEAGISRVLFYRWLKRYKEEGTVAPKKPARIPSRQVPEKYVLKIIAVIQARPSWSTRKVSETLGKDKEGKLIVGNHGVQNVFVRLSLNTTKKRKEFARKTEGLTDKQALDLVRGVFKRKPAVPRPAELSPKQRLEAIERVVKYNEPVAKVCIDFHISRPNFYKWLARYEKAPEDKKLEALADKKPKVKRYYRQTPEKYEEAVLSVVAQYPEFGVEKIVQALPAIAGKPIVGHHGVQNVLRRYDLNTYQKRLAYAQAQVTPVTRLISIFEEIGTRFIVLPVETRARIIRFTSVTLLTAFSTTLVLGILGYFVTITAATPVPSRIGLFFASIALSVGSIFFAYSMKYYLTLAIVLSFSRQPLEEGGGFAVGLNGRIGGNGRNGGNGGIGGWLRRIFGLNGGNGGVGGNGRRIAAGGLQPSLEHIKLKRYPFVSIHLPFYNERKVAERILKACTAMDYPSTRFARSGQVPQANYEIIVVDDSTDETTDIVQRYAKKHNSEHPDGPKIKILHRPTRQGFKGGALGYALKHIDPKAEFVVVFDADFIPYPDTLELFIKYFKANNPSTSTSAMSSVPNGSGQAHSEDYTKNNIACVAGYQWHVLNKSENWITRGVRTEYAGSYVIERPGQEILGAIKLIHGSVYAIRADVLKKFGWGTSITEDFELTLRLYAQGYKVIYTPYIQGPAECVSTLKRLIRQRMRWSEGHSHCIKKMFLRLIKSPKLNPMEKLEVLYLSPYYLQAFFFLVGTFSWLMAETVFRARLPFWTSLWGWSLVLTNFFSLPLVNAVGLFLEESEEKDYLGLLSFVALSYILVPFQAYASVKGFLEREEGPWFRTPKTGRITDIFTRGKFYRWVAGILPGKRGVPAYAESRANERLAWLNNPHVALATANNRFDNFKIRPRHLRWVGDLAFSSSIFLTSALIVFAPLLPLAKSTMAQGPGRLMTVGEAMVAQEPKEEEITTPRSFHFPTASGETLEMIFHKEPRVRIKIGDKELEITTKSIANLPALPKRSLIKENHEVIYEEIVPNVDLVYSLNAFGFEEKFIVKKKIELEKIEQLVIPREVKVVSPFEEVFGFYDQENKEIFEFGNPVIYEGETPSVKNQGVKITLKKGALGYNLRKTITSEGLNWISAPERKYPIIIDPSTIVSGGITTNMVKYGGNQRKLAYVSSAWYAVREDDAGTAGDDLGNIYYYKSTNGTSWSGGTSMDTSTDCANQRSGPSMWVDGTSIYVVWNSRNCTTYDDRLYFRPLATSTDTLGTLCYSADLGTIGGADINSIAKIGTTVYTVNDNDPDFMQTTNLTTCTGGTNWAVITTGHGVTATDRPVLDTNGTDLYVFFQDAQLSFSRFSSGSWTPANLTVSATTSTRFSAANDGTTLYLVSIDSATNNINLHTCTISTNCDVAGEWTIQTSPWTGLTNPNTVSVTLNPSAGQIFVSVVYGTAGSAKAYFKDSATSSISWSQEYDYGWTAGTVEETSSMYSVTDSTKIGVVLMSGTNFEFAVVPERTIVFLLLTPILPLALTKIRKGLKKRAQKRSQPAASLEKRTLMSVLLVACVLLMFLPFLVTFNDLLTQLIIKTQFYHFLQRTVIPWEIRLVGVLMMPLGFRPAVVGEYLGLGLTGATPRPFLLEIAWNCIGLQSLVFFIVTALVGLQGDKYTNGSKVKALMIGLLGTFLVNLGRITVVVLLAYYLGQNTAMMFHEYGSNLATLAWLFFFWWFAYAFVLEERWAYAAEEKRLLSAEFVPAFLTARANMPVRLNKYVALATANNQFNNFTIRPKRLRWVSKAALAVLLIISLTIFSLTRGVPEVLATNPNATQYLSNDASGVLTGVTSAWKLLDTVDSPQGSTSIDIDRNEAVDAQLQIEPGQTNTTTGTKCSTTPNGRGWILDAVFGSGGSIAAGAWSFFIYESDTGPNRQGHIDVCVYRTTVSGGLIGTANLLFQSQGDSSWSTTDTMNNATDSISQTTSSQSSFTIGPNEYLYIEHWYHNETKFNEATVTMTFYTGESGATDPYITTPGIQIPENSVLFAAATPFVVMMVLWMKKRKERLAFSG